MRLFLRHARTGYCYRDTLEWVMAPAEAKHFRGAKEALEVARKACLEGMTIVFRPDDTGADPVYPTQLIHEQRT